MQTGSSKSSAGSLAEHFAKQRICALLAQVSNNLGGNLLMILDGEIEVTHNGERTLAMKPLADVDEFEGGWETVSVGRCVDFNLMTVDGYRGAMSACAAGGGCAEIAPEGASEYWRGIYSLTDGLTVKCAAGGEEGEYSLDKGDFLLFSYSPAKEGTARVSLSSACGCAPAVCAEVWR